MSEALERLGEEAEDLEAVAAEAAERAERAWDEARIAWARYGEVKREEAESHE